ncbi:MAG TPA: hypothetical protein VFX16_30380 [Pseudonocardiaceae bacterium]|nr:hypothetical protein [Pseudonocardiaceae bacterium]
MYLQTCIKGIHGITDDQAEDILKRQGLMCNWWRRVRRISSAEIAERLTDAELELHVNAYDEHHPHRQGPVHQETPFLSLAAGTVERNTFLKTNLVHPAQRTALNFATDFGRLRGTCYLFHCWVVVGLTRAVPVRHLAEEVRDLNTYRRYSAFQLEGEVTAKIDVPSCQIQLFERYHVTAEKTGGIRIAHAGNVLNPAYIEPTAVANIRRAF